ncbi:hypothetical protein PTKIN_Ptkin02bG0039700 [Pterospermum kingtungense]
MPQKMYAMLMQLTFAKDMGRFLDARAKELVFGGIMALIMPSIPDVITNSCIASLMIYDSLGSSLMDMAKEANHIICEFLANDYKGQIISIGIICESQVDSFYLPLYNASPKEMKDIIERNGCVSIKSIEATNPVSKMVVRQGTRPCTMHLRAGWEGIISNHFGNLIIDELFDRFNRKAEENSNLFNASHAEGTQLFVVLIPK